MYLHVFWQMAPCSCRPCPFARPRSLAHLEGYFLDFLSPWNFTNHLFLVGIKARGCHHVKYFDGPKLQYAHDGFFGTALQVVDANVLIAAHVQALLVDHICNVLEQPRAAEWFKECWTGHAGYAGVITMWESRSTGETWSYLCPSQLHLAYSGALVKNIRDLCIEHYDFPCRQGHPNLFPSVPNLLKSMYDLMQELHPKTLSCAVMRIG
jgi:hypothetical protein